MATAEHEVHAVPLRGDNLVARNEEVQHLVALDGAGLRPSAQDVPQIRVTDDVVQSLKLVLPVQCFRENEARNPTKVIEELVDLVLSDPVRESGRAEDVQLVPAPGRHKEFFRGRLEVLVVKMFCRGDGHEREALHDAEYQAIGSADPAMAILQVPEESQQPTQLRWW